MFVRFGVRVSARFSVSFCFSRGHTRYILPDTDLWACIYRLRLCLYVGNSTWTHSCLTYRRFSILLCIFFSSPSRRLLHLLPMFESNANTHAQCNDSLELDQNQINRDHRDILWWWWSSSRAHTHTHTFPFPIQHFIIRWCGVFTPLLPLQSPSVPRRSNEKF